MNADDAAGRLRPVHWDRLKRRGSLAEASRRMEEDDGYLWEQRDNPRGLRVGDAFLSLEVLGSPMPEELLHEAYFSEPKDPAAILLYSKEQQGLTPDPWLSTLARGVEALAAAGPTLHGAWRSEGTKIREIDRQRRRHRRAAYRRLRKLLLRILGKLGGATRPESAFVELSSALGVLAAIYRLAGKRDDAVDVLVLARSLVRRTRDPRAEAEWYQKAAFLLVDLGRHSRAEDFILQAHKFFDLCGSSIERLGCLVDLAYILTHSQRYQESRDLLERVLPQLDEQDVESRIAAHQACGKNLQALGDLDGACKHLVAAMELVDDDLLARASCLWRLAKLLTALGDIPQALAMYREAMPLHAKLTDATDLAELAMEYASLLFKDGRRPELSLLAKDLAGWLEGLNARTRLRDTISDFKALVEMGNLDAKSFAGILKEVQAAKLRESRRSLRTLEKCPNR